MQKMRFSERQNEITIYRPENGVTDVIICRNEEVAEVNDENSEETRTEYVYDGNVFRTFKEITAEDIAADIDFYMEYPGDTEPTDEMVEYANAMIDAYTIQLIEEGAL